MIAENVSSFTVDHTLLKPGIYIARSKRGVTTFDIRITAPNREPAICGPEYHTLEHFLAIFLRNSSIKDDLIAIDAMACNTGFYMILHDHEKDHPYTVYEVRNILVECLDWITVQTSVPASTPETCGNCYYHNLPMAKYWAREFRSRLLNNFEYSYPKIEFVKHGQ